MNVFGYNTITTFWDDFSIADAYGIRAIKNTYERSFNDWKDDYQYLTELVMVLNWKLWYHYENGNEEYAKLYNELWREADMYAMDNLQGNELSYFIATTD